MARVGDTKMESYIRGVTVVKVRGFIGSLQLSCGDCPNLVCKGPVAAFKGTNSGITASRIV